MASSPLRSLKFQITTALILLLALFAGAILYTLHHLSRYHEDAVTSRVAESLDFSVQRLLAQGQNYLANPPRDYATYYRDVKLYYRDLEQHLDDIETAIHGFATGMLPKRLEGLDDDMELVLPEHVRSRVMALDEHWREYVGRLRERLGDDKAQPRLEWAAQHVVEFTPSLAVEVSDMVQALRSSLNTHQDGISRVNQWVLVFAAAFSLAIVAWFYLRVMRPLASAASAYERVSQGDFGHQIRVCHDDEIGHMTRAFNILSQRLNALFGLIDRLQTGDDLRSTVATAGRELGPLLPLDWLEVVLVGMDSERARVAAWWSPDDRPAPEGLWLDLNNGDAFGEALAARHPSRIAIPDELASLQLHTALILPLREFSDLDGALVFASGDADAYQDDHLELLRNLAPLLAHTFSRTLQFLDNERLAALGQFVSGIVHEIRNPLSTIGLALDYIDGREDLPEAVTRRSGLAAGEARRMERLLQEILLYAKPVSLHGQPTALTDWLQAFVEAQADLLADRHQRLVLTIDQPACVELDGDRMQQVLLNLLRNACDASPPEATITLRLTTSGGVAHIEMHNPGDAISETVRGRLFEPFFTTKAQGTGLGLPIVRRLVEAHGGVMEIESDSDRGTRFRVCLPAIPCP
ncbi:MAG: HAMP domain-containing protein [Gammaproteobacteria bacterium]|nr:HAMP domain-containing protein [Gammaproteobacteria bacterium]MCP5136656.1 HAMP domain-containing protein [Gammaproteobacteria bacterium]